jgi:hypothetical protein
MMKPICELFGKQTTTSLGEKVTIILKLHKRFQEAITFNNRLWCCCNYQEAAALAKEFVNLVEK